MASDARHLCGWRVAVMIGVLAIATSLTVHLAIKHDDLLILLTFIGGVTYMGLAGIR